MKYRELFSEGGNGILKNYIACIKNEQWTNEDNKYIILKYFGKIQNTKYS